jgi:hypothetical protein
MQQVVQLFSNGEQSDFDEIEKYLRAAAEIIPGYEDGV